MLEQLLPQQLQAELNLPRGRGRRGNDARRCGRQHSRGRREDDRVRIVEIGAIENIEQLGPELKVEPLREQEFFGHGEIGFREAGSLQEIARRGAVRVGQRLNERVRVEILPRAALDDRARKGRIH